MSPRRGLQHANFFAFNLQVRCTAVLECAAPTVGQPGGDPDQGPTKRCLHCGDERTLFYFPVRKAQPNGWVHCYACQRDLRLEAKPPRPCAHSQQMAVFNVLWSQISYFTYELLDWAPTAHVVNVTCIAFVPPPLDFG
jgi:hypothetical protein